MTKVEFIIELNNLLTVLAKKDKEEAISFYVELIEDKMEKGMSEAEAIESLGSINDLANQILEDNSKKQDEEINVQFEEVKEDTTKREKVFSKEENIFTKFMDEFNHATLFTKIVVIILLVIALPITIGYMTSIFPLVILALIIFIVYSLRNSKLSDGTRKTYKDILKILLVVGVIVSIPLLIALYVAPFGIFGGTSILAIGSGIGALVNLSFNSMSSAISMIGMLIFGISLGLLSISVLASLYKSLNHILKSVYNELKREANEID